MTINLAYVSTIELTEKRRVLKADKPGSFAIELLQLIHEEKQASMPEMADRLKYLAGYRVL
jgi:predicted transcriptional regulator